MRKTTKMLLEYADPVYLAITFIIYWRWIEGSGDVSIVHNSSYCEVTYTY